MLVSMNATSWLEGEAGDRTCSVGSDSGQLLERLDIGWKLAAMIDHCLGGSLEVDCTPVIPQAGPDLDHVGRWRFGKRVDGRESFQPAVEVGDHPVDLRLLEHYLGNEDGIGIARVPPGQVAPVVLPPAEQVVPERENLVERRC